MTTSYTSHSVCHPGRAATRALAGIMILTQAMMPSIVYADITDIAAAPLATSATSVVKPNVMYILDDSGSMGWDFTPDYVNDGGSAAGCYDGGDDGGGITGSPDTCQEGDPPYMSTDYNSQYYNPEITYTPPVNYDGSNKPSQTAANTSNWTAVKNDGFGAQSTSTTNLVTGYPDRKWCDDTAGTTCRFNADYTYPDAGYSYGLAATGAPYYYQIIPSEYCTTSDLTSCTVSSSPTGIYTVPATLRWCDSAALTNCQARRVGNFIRPKYLGTVNPGAAAKSAVAATGSVKIGNSGTNDPVSITGLKVNGIDIISGTLTASGGTNSPSEQQDLANTLCNAINTYVSVPEYYARNIGTSSTSCSNTGSSTVTIVAGTVGSAVNGFAVAVGTTTTPTKAATATISISSASSGSSISGGVTIGGIVVSGSSALTTAATSSAANKELRDKLRSAIQSYTSVPEYTAVDSSKSSNTLIVSAALSEGSSANGRVITIGTSGTVTVSITDCTSVVDAMCGGVTVGLPTTITNMSGGADAVAAMVAFRQNTGSWSRTDIVSTNNSYPKASTRGDCSGASCTYAEEMTNFANWYAYYRTRMQMMKTAAGRAFVSLGSGYRVGLITINNRNFTPVADFTSTQKNTWYTRFYGSVPGSGTPLREALSRVGRYFGHVTSGINSSMTDDPVQYSCQQNFSILTTDGYWNGNGGQDLSGAVMGNHDNSDAGYSTRADGAYDGGLAGSTNTLADVAMYYYKTDLRPNGSTGALGTDVGTDNNVPSSGKDNAPHQHMTTFTLGLGIDGLMQYKEDYESSLTGDFKNISSGASNCAWALGASVACNWPVPVADSPTALDDLWHTAVNGRGTYFSARNPVSLYTGLTNALQAVQARVGSAAASATSTPNVTQTDHFIYSSTYRTQDWDGEIVAQEINTSDGTVGATISWSAQGLLDNRTAATSDTRNIYVFDSAAANRLKAFAYGSLSTSELTYFNNQACVTVSPAASPVSPLAQCTTGMPVSDQVEANKAQNLIAYLRGQTGSESTLYRTREHILGDFGSSKPAYVRLSPYAFTDTGHAAFRVAQASRSATIYIGANDGMLHAFNGDTGVERWAFIPKSVFPGLYKLAASDYATNHRYYVDGTPETMDIYDTSASAWKTILVGGLNGGGRGYYALDVTDPSSPKGLWEFCSDSSLCSVSDSDLGLSYGNPVTAKRASDGKWVVLVTSGYNNVSPGTGRGYLYVLDALTGAVLQKIDTGEGSTVTPLGLAKIAGYADNGNINNTVKWVYGGDLQGNVWRFDLTTSPATVMQLATLKDGSTPARPQSITTKPELARKNTTPLVIVGTGRYLGSKDLPDGATLTPVLPYAYQNSLYTFMDTQTNLGDLRARSDIQVRTLTQPTVTTRTIASTPAMNWVTKKGWYIDFNPFSASPGERLNVDPQLIAGTILLASNVPANTACSAGGDSWFYQLDYLSGTFVSTAANSTAAVKANNITVGFVVVRLPSGAIKIIKTDSAGNKDTAGANIGSSGGGGRRTSWRELSR